MRVRFELELQLSPLQKRVARWGVVLGVAIGAVGIGAAIADPTINTTWIEAGAPVQASMLAQNLNALQAQLNDPQCPVNYLQEPSDGGSVVACYNPNVGTPMTTVDEVVKVGAKWGAFWIDRYEASLYDNPQATGLPYGGINNLGGLLAPQYPGSFTDDGQGTTLWASSRRGVAPSGLLTWYQAMQACAASGKRLPTGEEWLLAATGTPDPGSNSGGGSCSTAGKGPAQSSVNDKCISVWGAENMIGNLWEWTNEWFATLPINDSGPGQPSGTWPGALYNDDGTQNMLSSVALAPDGGQVLAAHLPAVGLRGGAWTSGTAAGVFALSAAASPAGKATNYGFRCVIRR